MKIRTSEYVVHICDRGSKVSEVRVRGPDPIITRIPAILGKFTRREIKKDIPNREYLGNFHLRKQPRCSVNTADDQEVMWSL